MIEAAVLLSALVQHWADFGIILVLLVGNAVVGFWEEYQAGNAIAALKPPSRCRRGYAATASGSSRPRANLCRATACGYDSAISCRPMRGCWTAIRWRSTSRP